MIGLLASSNQPPQPPGSSALYSSVLLVVFVIYISYRRLYRGMHGRRYSSTRLLRIPVIYSIITVASSAFMPLEYVFIAMGVGVAGLAAGIFFGDTANFFEKKSATFYTRSPVIMIIWLAAFISRVAIELYYDTSTSFIGSAGNSPAAIIVNLLLAGSTGLLAGETVRTYRKYLEYRNGQSDTMITDGLGNS